MTWPECHRLVPTYLERGSYMWWSRLISWRLKTSRWSCLLECVTYSHILRSRFESDISAHPSSSADLWAQPAELLAWLFTLVMITVNFPSVLPAKEFPFINTDTSQSAQSLFSSVLFWRCHFNHANAFNVNQNPMNHGTVSLLTVTNYKWHVTPERGNNSDLKCSTEWQAHSK